MDRGPRRATRLGAIKTKYLSNGSSVESYAYSYDKTVDPTTMGQVNGTQLSFAYRTDYSLNATTYESGSKYYYNYDPNDNRLYKNQTDGLTTSYVYGADSSLSSRVPQDGHS